MSVQAKYQPVLDFASGMDVQNGSVMEENGVLKVVGTVNTQYEKNQLWDRIKEIGGDNPSDIVADIRVAQTAYFAKYTVEKGDSLSKIAKHFYGDMMKYKQIFEANRSILDDPDRIEVGQELIIPFEK
ncbi:MAG TPA: LysM peptidoglycan-binding domain-containing protein [Saprospiraceae bacterium]|nr:LysM peptidoglycan-binding domain-containing protein [Saprospiraceae bacterium]HNL39952.1 LysM peptidoglycan-binding domain-containing protein [Saprospiraceae bacterium]HNM25440.1 LysM peptidoglycan-binding domain-containing protein [Saprospiraceae bacterium]